MNLHFAFCNISNVFSFFNLIFLCFDLGFVLEKTMVRSLALNLLSCLSVVTRVTKSLKIESY